MAHVLSGRAETPTQSRILTYVRDEGPLSRMDLASRLNVSRTTVAAEVGRLVESAWPRTADPRRHEVAGVRRWWTSTPDCASSASSWAPPP